MEENTGADVDMDPWVREKLTHTLRALAQMIDECRKPPDTIQANTEESVQESLQGHLHVAIFNNTKILALFSDRVWDVSDKDMVFSEGYKGYMKLLEKYGLLSS